MSREMDFDGPKIVASFPITLDLPRPDDCQLEEVASAVESEYFESVQEMVLECVEWEHIDERENGVIHALKLGRAVQFDWRWEGAIAYQSEEESDDSEDSRDIEPTWEGEIVEVDETRGCIYVLTKKPDQTPRRGNFIVRPFEFLAVLNEVYQGSSFAEVRKYLPGRLAATGGGIHPRVDPAATARPRGLDSIWDYRWGILWGPPGTGKTYQIGRLAASRLDDPTERLLVVSTTNKAVDGVALQIGKSCRASGGSSDFRGRIVRVGNGVNIKEFEENGLGDLVQGGDDDLLREVSALKERHAAETDPETRARFKVEISARLEQITDPSRCAFLAKELDVVVATAYRASTALQYPEIRRMLEDGKAPFTTIIIDEAGLISRAATAALSLLASRRVILVGDPRQLAPISRMARVMPTLQARWIADSGIGGLERGGANADGVHLLTKQYRMHPEIGDAVSEYQYGGKLSTAEEAKACTYEVPKLLRGQPRVIWYVIDEEKGEPAHIRADRGPGHRSWIRRKTRDVLEKLLSDPGIRESSGLFITPFVAQAKTIATMFAEKGLTSSWSASTVHARQGAEADIVVFDTVNAGSTGWPIHEWIRLINVGMSRAREYIILVASRAEMQSPFLRPLLRSFQPRVLQRVGSSWKWSAVTAGVSYGPAPRVAANSELLGVQIQARKLMQSVLSHDQQRLIGFEMDGKPRLVRGVAGSGKTVVLGHWLKKTLDRLEGQPSSIIWAVFANASLRRLLEDTIESAWKEDEGERPFPWHRIDLWHVRDVLDLLLREVGTSMSTFGFDYDKAAEAYLKAKEGRAIAPLCHALFVDEGQDLGPNTLKLLTALVEHGDPEHPHFRSVNIFYDNAQNVYGRSTPKWSEMGLDMRGRSTVMKESFRATRPITEFAFNVLHRLNPDEARTPDHKELVEMELVEAAEYRGKSWWNIRFTQIEGPLPTFKKSPSKVTEFRLIGEQLVRWISHERVMPRDIRILYMSEYPRSMLEKHVKPMLEGIGVDLEFQKGEVMPSDDRTVIATTPHSFKGYDAEIVVIPCVEMFQVDGKPLTQALYVAMTRARSVLAIHGQGSGEPGKSDIVGAIEECLDALKARPRVETAVAESDEDEKLPPAIGPEQGMAPKIAVQSSLAP